MELVFLKFDAETIRYVVEQILIPGFQHDVLEYANSSLTTLDFFNDYIITNLKKPNKK